MTSLIWKQFALFISYFARSVCIIHILDYGYSRGIWLEQGSLILSEFSNSHLPLSYNSGSSQTHNLMIIQCGMHKNTSCNTSKKWFLNTSCNTINKTHFMWFELNFNILTPGNSSFNISHFYETLCGHL